MKTRKEYPDWAYSTNREWLRSIRKRWVALKRTFRGGIEGGIMTGSAFYPDEIKNMVNKLESDMIAIDKKMKEYLKKA